MAKLISDSAYPIKMSFGLVKFFGEKLEQDPDFAGNLETLQITKEAGYGNDLWIITVEDGRQFKFRIAKRLPLYIWESYDTRVGEFEN